jgi:hypothetical protein
MNSGHFGTLKGRKVDSTAVETAMFINVIIYFPTRDPPNMAGQSRDEISASHSAKEIIGYDQSMIDCSSLKLTRLSLAQVQGVVCTIGVSPKKKTAYV